MLFSQNRRDLAERELRQAIGHDPNEMEAYALLALCLADAEDAKSLTEAKACAERAVGLSPDSAFPHYVLARVLAGGGAMDRARASINEAIRLDPSEPQFWAVLSQIEIGQKNFKAALAAAEQGLTFDAEHEGCVNLRAVALTNLGDRAAATQAIEATLQRNPLNSVSHANMGWTLLHQGEPRKAMEHFRESLKLDPTSEWARQGIIEAMKARNPVYRVFLAYFLFMSRLSSGAQWAILVGGFFGVRLLRSVSASNPALAPYIDTAVAVYVAFAIGTVVAVPLFNLFLFVSPFGRHALNAAQRWAALVFGLFLLPPLGCLVLWAVTGSDLFEFLALFTGMFCVPVALAGMARAGTPRWVMIGYAALMLLIGVATVGATLVGMPWASTLVSVYVIGAIGSTWLSNIVQTIRPPARV